MGTHHIFAKLSLIAIMVNPVAFCAEAHKCTSAAEKVERQERQCESVDSPIEVTPSVEVEPKSKPKNDNDFLFGLTLVVLSKASCDNFVPGFREKAAENWNRFRQLHLATIKEIESSEIYQKAAVQKPASSLSPSEVQEVKQQCNDEFIEQLGQISEPPNPKFSSPEGTWSVWLTALRTANRKEAASCLAGPARSRYVEAFKKLNDENLKKMGNTVGNLSKPTAYGNAREFFVIRQDGQAGIVTFTNVNGQWLITEM